ncbi:hypothetical protein H6P81_011453 [Aristolochia fimbriata]|uniref:Peptidase C14 caspase domain-containing protein n=1 Tax=Aristolochia fimbriata TaxID=158543 RepID=A0AAV7EW15_ARIFI|nr:hypothetical protein H6P81_011453 [Aristolochia fimbriata]
MTGFQRCSGCGGNVQVPAEAHSVKCTSCLTTNLVHANSGTSHVQTERRMVPSSRSNVHGSHTMNVHGSHTTNVHGSHTTNVHGSHTTNAHGSHTMNGLRTSCPSFHGRKRAVLCGVSYKCRRNELKGSANAVSCMKALLRNKLGFPDDCILVLSEDENNTCRLPTKQNMRSAMRWLVQDCKAGDSLVFYFVGHGSQQIDCSGDEADGYDESLCPMDYETEGNIIDDEINTTIVRPLPKGAKLHAIIDASHSGTAMDLPFVCRMGRSGSYLWENQSPACSYKGTCGGMAVSFSSCNDKQTGINYAKNTTGAMTYCFVDALEREHRVTYGCLLNLMRAGSKELKAGGQTCNPISSLVRKLVAPGVAAEPQLSASEKFDIQKLQFAL